MHDGSITIRLPVDLNEIERLNRLVRKFGALHEVPSRTLYAVNLALDEIVTNVVLHGFDKTAGQELIARLSLQQSQFTVEVEDGGRAFNPHDAPPPDLNAPLEKRELGGLGIHLVKSLMDRVDYRRDGAKNILTMHRRVR